MKKDKKIRVDDKFAINLILAMKKENLLTGEVKVKRVVQN